MGKNTGFTGNDLLKTGFDKQAIDALFGWFCLLVRDDGNGTVNIKLRAKNAKKKPVWHLTLLQKDGGWGLRITRDRDIPPGTYMSGLDASRQEEARLLMDPEIDSIESVRLSEDGSRIVFRSRKEEVVCPSFGGAVGTVWTSIGLDKGCALHVSEHTEVRRP